MAEGKKYWLIAAPKGNPDTFNTLSKKVAEESDLAKVFRFPIPDLKVGTLDALMTLSDELHKVDALVENVTRKIATQLYDILENMKAEGAKADNNNDPSSDQVLLISNITPTRYLELNWKWEEAKYQSGHSLRALTELIHSQVVKIDEELKGKVSEYTGVVHSLYAEERKAGGNWLTKDLSDVVKKDHVMDSEYMVTLFVAVPKFSVKVFLATYEKFTEYVLPRSAELISEDSEYAIYRVIVFRKIAEDFKNASRERKFTVREFVYDPNRSGKNDKKKLEGERERLRTNLIRWCKLNFAEAFTSWIHVKAIRTFVESVLRYGLPTNFQAMLVVPNKGKIKPLRKALNELYKGLSAKQVYSNDNETDGEGESYFPYVYLEVNLDFKNKGVL